MGVAEEQDNTGCCYRPATQAEAGGFQNHSQVRQLREVSSRTKFKQGLGASTLAHTCKPSNEHE